jgi:hypothetical protein
LNTLLSSPTSCSFCNAFARCFLIMVTAEKIVIPTPRTIGIQLDVHKLSITRAAGNRKTRHANVDIIRRDFIDSRIIPISITSLELAWIHCSSSIVRMVQPRNKFWPPPQAKLKRVRIFPSFFLGQFAPPISLRKWPNEEGIREK